MKRVRSYKVTNLSKVDTTLYKDGDIFYTDRSIGILHKGKIKTVGEIPDLTDYVKKDEVQAMIPDVSEYVTADEVQAMIPDVSEYVTADEVQAMIDEAIKNLGGGGDE